MKKNYLYLLGALLLAVLSVAFVACGSDDDDDNGVGTSGDNQTLLVGTWSRKVTGSCAGTESWTFNKNGTGYFTMNTSCNKGSSSFTYSIITYAPTSRIGYVRIIYTQEDRKWDGDFTLNGNSLYLGGASYTK
jgi:hypothetical protein